MIKYFMREHLPYLLTCLLLLGGLFTIYGHFQRADLNFDASVARPSFVDLHPQVLFDEGHLNFHTVNGRYKPFADLIKNDGYRVTQNTEGFQRGKLDHYRLLIIANATGPNELGDGPAFTEEECDAVRDWVRAGGSLLLITDVYPYGSAAANLARRFGVEMSKGLTEDAAHSLKNSRRPGVLVFSRENGLLGDHPITAGREPRERLNCVMTFSGQSLKGPPESVAFLRLAETAEDRIPKLVEELSVDGLPDPTIKYVDTIPATGRAQGIAMKFGQGRVVILGEAAMLTAQLSADDQSPFGMNVEGNDNRQLTLNIMHWLSSILD